MASPLDSHDVLSDILLRLPAKSLIRFKSVCKNWLSLISSDYFCLQHTLGHPKLQPSLILLHWSRRWESGLFYRKPPTINGENVMIPYRMGSGYLNKFTHILQGCNGLLLLKTNHYRVYNPTTRLSSEVNIPDGNDVGAMALAFDPSRSPHYKIVCIVCSSSAKDDMYRVEVYDSGSRSWKHGFGPFTHPSGFGNYEAQYHNNAIFWWRYSSNDYYCFDIAKNEMREFPFPQHDIALFRSYLQELDGRLYLLRYGHKGVEVLESRGDASNPRWLLRHWGNDHALTLQPHSCCYQRRGKCIIAMQGDYSDGSLQLIYYDREEMKMGAYNFLRRRCEDLVDFTPPLCGYFEDGMDYHVIKIFRFGETLALV